MCFLSLTVMQKRVLYMIDQFQIANIVIQPVSVYVMDVFPS